MNKQNNQIRYPSIEERADGSKEIALRYIYSLEQYGMKIRNYIAILLARRDLDEQTNR